MTAETYAFRLGDLDAIIVPEENGPLSQERFNGIFSGDDSQDIRDAFAQLDSPMFSRNGLYLKDSTQHVLVDTGEGRLGSGRMIERLIDAGVRPDQIDLLIITHFHGDHFGGMVDADSAPVFPNARVVVSRREWEHWMSEDFLAAMQEPRRQALQQSFAPYVSAGRLAMVDDGQAIAPEIRAVNMPGHTPGQMGLSITSGDASLLHIADAAHFPIQGHFVHRIPRFDSDPEQAIATRRSVFERVADDQLVMLAYHFPFPGLGHVTRSDGKFDWHPLAAK